MSVEKFRPETTVGGPAPKTGATAGSLIAFLRERLLQCQMEDKVRNRLQSSLTLKPWLINIIMFFLFLHSIFSRGRLTIATSIQVPIILTIDTLTGLIEGETGGLNWQQNVAPPLIALRNLAIQFNMAVLVTAHAQEFMKVDHAGKVRSAHTEVLFNYMYRSFLMSLRLSLIHVFFTL